MAYTPKLNQKCWNCDGAILIRTSTIDKDTKMGSMKWTCKKDCERYCFSNNEEKMNIYHDYKYKLVGKNI